LYAAFWNDLYDELVSSGFHGKVGKVCITVPHPWKCNFFMKVLKKVREWSLLFVDLWIRQWKVLTIRSQHNIPTSDRAFVGSRSLNTHPTAFIYSLGTAFFYPPGGAHLLQGNRIG
jgi:hypothetical protein